MKASGPNSGPGPRPADHGPRGLDHARPASDTHARPQRRAEGGALGDVDRRDLDAQNVGHQLSPHRAAGAAAGNPDPADGHAEPADD